MGKNIKWQETKVTKTDRQRLNQHKSLFIWFTGLSAAGKSTIASRLEQQLHARAIKTYLLDGDNVRHGLNVDLDFKDAARTENIRRIGEVGKLMVDAGLVVIASFISPFIKDRQRVRKLMAAGEFIEIYVKCPLAVCHKRDPKGLYKKAASGKVKNFTGLDSIYEEPVAPEIILDTEASDVDKCVEQVLQYLDNQGCLQLL